VHRVEILVGLQHLRDLLDAVALGVEDHHVEPALRTLGAQRLDESAGVLHGRIHDHELAAQLGGHGRGGVEALLRVDLQQHGQRLARVERVGVHQTGDGVRGQQDAPLQGLQDRAARAGPGGLGHSAPSTIRCVIFPTHVIGRWRADL
jgi:hypothetical protein